MAAQGVVNFEMEASAVLTLAALAGCRAGVVCTVFAQRTSGAFATAEAASGRQRLASWRPGSRRSTCWPRWTNSAARAGELHWRPSHWAPKMAP